MNPLVREWIQKAEGDYATAGREFVVTENPNYDAVCFHAQQCAEKYIKAALVSTGLEVLKTHDLGALLNRLVPAAPEIGTLRGHANVLVTQAVEVRYPGVSADRQDAEEALDATTAIRKAIRGWFGISGGNT